MWKRRSRTAAGPGQALFVRLAAHPVPRVSRMMGIAQSRGLVPVFVGGLRDPGLPREGVWDGFAVRRVGPVHEALNGRGLLRYLRGTLAFNVAVLRMLRNSSPAVVHVSDFEASIFTIPYCRLVGTPVIYNIHDNIGDRYDLPLAFRRILAVMEGLMILLSSVAAVPEQYRRDSLPAWCRRKVHVIRNSPVDPWAGDPPATELRDEVRILYAGWIDEGRGIATMLALAEELPWVSLTMAGEGDKELVSRAVTSERVRYVGYLDHDTVMKAVADAHFVIAMYDPVRPINILAAPNKLAEAFCTGRPVIINSEVLVGADPEFGDAVVRFAYSDFPALVSALEEVRARPEKYQTMCQQARRNYDSAYSWDTVRSQSEELFRRVGL